jgi:hypothetical protein
MLVTIEHVYPGLANATEGFPYRKLGFRHLTSQRILRVVVRAEI